MQFITPARRYWLDLLESGGPMTVNQIGATSGSNLTTARIYQVLQDLVKMGVAHICEYEILEYGYAACYKFGPGVNAVRPGTHRKRSPEQKAKQEARRLELKAERAARAKPPGSKAERIAVVQAKENERKKQADKIVASAIKKTATMQLFSW